LLQTETGPSALHRSPAGQSETDAQTTLSPCGHFVAAHAVEAPPFVAQQIMPLAHGIEVLQVIPAPPSSEVPPELLPELPPLLAPELPPELLPEPPPLLAPELLKPPPEELPLVLGLLLSPHATAAAPRTATSAATTR
jgi:hypothetical protein